jgi:hypothetical protein
MKVFDEKKLAGKRRPLGPGLLNSKSQSGQNEEISQMIEIVNNVDVFSCILG